MPICDSLLSTHEIIKFMFKIRSLTIDTRPRVPIPFSSGLAAQHPENGEGAAAVRWEQMNYPQRDSNAKLDQN